MGNPRDTPFLHRGAHNLVEDVTTTDPTAFRLAVEEHMLLLALVYGQCGYWDGYAKNRRLSRLPPHRIGMIIDRGHDFPQSIQSKLESYGSDMWSFRDHSDRGTTRAINSYRGDHRRFLSNNSCQFSDQQYVVLITSPLELGSPPTTWSIRNWNDRQLCISFVLLREPQVYCLKYQIKKNGPQQPYSNPYLSASQPA